MPCLGAAAQAGAEEARPAEEGGGGMTATSENRDTREDVEAVCSALTSINERGWIAEEDCDRAAAMLRRLVRQRDKAEADLMAAIREVSEAGRRQGKAEAALATARIDALREAAEAARCVPIPEDCSAEEAHGRISAALQAAMNILALITQEQNHAE